MVKKLTDDEIMAKALLCPESEKVPLEVGDRVIALEDFMYYPHRIQSGTRGLMVKRDYSHIPYYIKWDSVQLAWWGLHNPAIGKLVKRGSV